MTRCKGKTLNGRRCVRDAVLLGFCLSCFKKDNFKVIKWKWNKEYSKL